MNLTRENTAIVLDSTADFDAQIRFPNMRVVPLYVRFGEESFRDYVELDPHDFYERLKTASELPTTSQPTPQDFLTVYHALAGYERIYSCTSRRSSRAPSRARRSRRPTRATGSGSSTPSRRRSGSGCSSLGIQELLARGTTDEEVEALIARTESAPGSSSPSTRSSSSPRADGSAAKALIGQPAQRQADPLDRGRQVVPLTRARGRAKAFEEFRKRFEEATTDGPGLAVGIAHAEAEDAVEQLRGIVLASRPQADVKLVTSLGAVVGTHAGPGTVGFFWFQP